MFLALHMNSGHQSSPLPPNLPTASVRGKGEAEISKKPGTVMFIPLS